MPVIDTSRRIVSQRKQSLSPDKKSLRTPLCDLFWCDRLACKYLSYIVNILIKIDRNLKQAEMEQDHPFAEYVHERCISPLEPIKDLRQYIHKDKPPVYFDKAEAIVSPALYVPSYVHETVTLASLNDFRKRYPPEGDTDEDDCLALFESLQVSTRPALYRYTDDTLPNGLRVLEAVHFELFSPDRYDLRFVGLKSSKAKHLLEGDLVWVDNLTKIVTVKASKPAINVLPHDKKFCMHWKADEIRAVPRPADAVEVEDLIYIYGKDWNGDFLASSVLSKQPLLLRKSRHPGLKLHTLRQAEMYESNSAWIYPVEPPKNAAEYADLVKKIKSSSTAAGIYARSTSAITSELSAEVEDRLADFEKFETDHDHAMSLHLKLLELGSLFRNFINPVEVVNATISLSQADHDPIFCIRKLRSRAKSVRIRLVDSTFRLKATHTELPNRNHPYFGFIMCEQNTAFKKVFLDEDRKRRAKEKKGRDPFYSIEIEADVPDPALNAIQRASKPGRGLASINANFFNHIYGRKGKYNYPTSTDAVVIRKSNGELLTMNNGQSKAVRHYLGSCPGLCVESPPGSGKTTTAAAMAVKAMEEEEGGIQLLMAVQNVAVANMAKALESLDVNSDFRALHYLSQARLESSTEEERSAYDARTILEKEPFKYAKKARNEDIEIVRNYVAANNELNDLLETKMDRKLRPHEKERMEELEEEVNKLFTKAIRIILKWINPKIILSTVDKALMEAMQVMFGQQDEDEDAGKKKDKKVGTLMGQEYLGVTRIIIDEASQLTEAAFYAVMRLFPKAKIVLIGDVKQLPPFMYEKGVLGHEIAARAALTVAMTKRNLPIVTLNEVYRAPPSLVMAYSNLFYDGTLVSRKPELKRGPLSKCGLIKDGEPQLLFVDVQGKATKPERSFSWQNKEELTALKKLLERLHKSKIGGCEIMIISMYKAQRNLVEKELDEDEGYEILTVDSAQGRERPVVILLTTRDTFGKEGFFACRERCNVAISRQQQALIVFGNEKAIKKVSPWKSLFHLCKSQGRIVSATKIGFAC